MKSESANKRKAVRGVNNISEKERKGRIVKNQGPRRGPSGLKGHFVVASSGVCFSEGVLMSC